MYVLGPGDPDMFKYVFNDEYRIMLWRQAVELNIDFMLEIIEELHKIEKTHSPFHRFVDLTEVTGISLHYDDLKRIAGMRTEYAGPKVKSAFYSMNPLGYGIGRMYQVLMEETNVEVDVFRDVDACAQWLGCPVAILRLE